MNKTGSAKDGYSPDYIKKQSLSRKRFRIAFNLGRVKKLKQVPDRLEKYDKVLYSRKKKKLRENFGIGKHVLLLTKRIKKKSVSEKFTKVQFKSFLILIKEDFLLIKQKNNRRQDILLGSRYKKQ